jgi:hypothetical protein
MDALVGAGCREIAAWKFEIGDPTLSGWLITVGYLVAGVLCFGRGWKAGRGHVSGQTRPWWILTVLLAALAANKQLDLQTLLVETGRSAAFAEGWYGDRRSVEFAFLILAVVIGATFFSWFIRRHLTFVRAHRWLFAGLTLIFVYCAIRAADIDHVELFGAGHSGSEILWPLELSGVALILAGLLLRKSASRPEIVWNDHRR